MNKIDGVEITDVERDCNRSPGTSFVGRIDMQQCPWKGLVFPNIHGKFYFIRGGEAVRALVYDISTNGEVMFGEAPWLDGQESMEDEMRLGDTCIRVVWFGLWVVVGAFLWSLFF